MGLFWCALLPTGRTQGWWGVEMMRWMRLPRGQMGQWQRSIKDRVAQHLARRLGHGEVVLRSKVTRATPENLDLHKRWIIEMDRFQIQDGQIQRL